MGILIDLGIAKTNKYASRESGDTVEVVERPTGGLSVVVADGQGSGRAAKSLSLLVTAKAAAMLSDGVRDGAVARGVNDALFALRHGQVSATLDILSVDARTETVLVTRFASTPMIVGQDATFDWLACDSGPLGVRPLARPKLRSWPLTAGTWIVLGTDGITSERADGSRLDLVALTRTLCAEGAAQPVADALLSAALARDAGKPRDDMTVVVLRLGDHDEEPRVRRMSLRAPLP